MQQRPGELRFTVYRGTNLVRMEAIAKTEEDSVAYIYEAGLSGFSTDTLSRVAWTDLGGNPQQYRFGGVTNDTRVAVKAANRVLVAEGLGGSVAAFPPPFVEVVWGDGTNIEREIVSATDLPPFGSKHFRIPFDATGKAWVRFAVWDSAGNGAFVQPVWVTQSTTSSAARTTTGAVDIRVSRCGAARDERWSIHFSED